MKRLREIANVGSSAASLGRRWVRSDTSIIILSGIAGNAARLVSTIILTRMLSAADFGVVGAVSAIMAVFVLLSDIGFYAFIIRHERTHDSVFLDEVWTIRLIRGAGLTALIAVLSPLLALGLGKEQLTSAIALCSLQILFEAASSLAFATAARDRRIRRLVLLDLVPILFQVGASILLAYLIGGYMALIYAILAASLLKCMLSYILFADARRRVRLSWQRSKEILKFGRFVVASSSLQMVVSQSDKLFLGRTLPLSEFGLYVIASNIAALPGSLAHGYSQRIIYPLLAASHREHGSVTAAYYGVGRPFRLLYSFAAGGFIGCAPALVMLLYDDRYLRAGYYLQILAIAALLRIWTLVPSEALMAAGHVKQTAAINLVRGVSLVTLGAGLFLWMGPVGIIFAVVGMEGAALLYSWYALRSLGIWRPSRELQFIIAALAGLLIGYAVNALAMLLQ